MPDAQPRAAERDTPDPGGQEVLVLAIEDDPQIRQFLARTLPNHGFRLIESATATDGIRDAETRCPDLIILDLGLPDRDGLEVIHALRQWTRVPILVLSARGQERDKVAALDAGADDYVAKPFGLGELLARIRVALRHAASPGDPAQEAIVVVGDLQVDLPHRRVILLGEEVHLTPIEYRLVATLARHAGKVLTQRQLLTDVWGPPYVDQAHYLRVYMGQLRRKLEKDPARPKYLLTEAGVGYRLAIE